MALFNGNMRLKRSYFAIMYKRHDYIQNEGHVLLALTQTCPNRSEGLSPIQTMSGLEVIGGAAAIMQLIINVVQMNSRMKDLLRKARSQSDLLEELSNQVKSIIASAESIPSVSCQASAAVPIARLCADRAIALHRLLTK